MMEEETSDPGLIPCFSEGASAELHVDCGGFDVNNYSVLGADRRGDGVGRSRSSAVNYMLCGRGVGKKFLNSKGWRISVPWSELQDPKPKGSAAMDFQVYIKLLIGDDSVSCFSALPC